MLNENHQHPQTLIEKSRNNFKGVCSITVLAFVFLLSSFIGQLLFSESTSPIGKDLGVDSSIFQVIGKYWAQGSVPYTNLWDHKGPLIFFIDALGYSLTGTAFGIFLIQVAFSLLFEIFAYRQLRQHLSKIPSAIFAAAFPLLYMSLNAEGNLTEEYILPFIMASFYGFEAFFLESKDKSRGFRPLFGCFCGIALGVALMTRAANAIQVCIGALLIFFLLMVRKKYKNAFINCLSFLLGTLIVVIPFSLYFYLVGSFEDYLFGTFLYNLQYASDTASSFWHIFSYYEVFVICTPCWILAIACIIGLTLKKKPGERIAGRQRFIFWLIICIVGIAFFGRLREYNHYGMLFLPLVYIAFPIIVEVIKQLKGSVSRKQTIIVLLSLIILINSGSYANRIFAKVSATFFSSYQVSTTTTSHISKTIEDPEFSRLLNLIPKNDEFVLYGFHARDFLKLDIRPLNRFFVLTGAAIYDSRFDPEEEIIKQMRADYLSHNYPWILATQIEKLAPIQDILDERYSLVDSSQDDSFRLYKLQ